MTGCINPSSKSKSFAKMQHTTMQRYVAEAEGPPCVNSPQPLRNLFAEAARKYPNNTAVCSMYQQQIPAFCISSSTSGEGLVWTYEQLHKAADLLAAAFYDRGIRTGMRIAAFLFNAAE